MRKNRPVTPGDMRIYKGEGGGGGQSANQGAPRGIFKIRRPGAATTAAPSRPGTPTGSAARDVDKIQAHTEANYAQVKARRDRRSLAAGANARPATAQKASLLGVA